MSEKLTISKALKILYDHEDILGGHDDYWNAYRFIEKLLKAFEIIKEKTVNIWLIQNKENIRHYNSMIDSSRWLTQEEFDLLKGVLL